ncbi:uncharacterized protein [Ptychodera flava]|uniref:uncharacterized protein n=1 Tax=Ptychodera flava TaxID=63121 RepID=UPI00396A4512
MVKSANKTVRHGFTHGAVAAFGITHIILGSLIILCGTFLLAIGEDNDILAMIAPLVCGTFIVVTGVVGFLAAKWKTNCAIISTMVMCILSAGLIYPTLLLVRIIIFLMALFESCGDTCFITEVVVFVLGFVDFLVAIVNSACCCSALCCASRTSQPIVYHRVSAEASPKLVSMETMQDDNHMVMQPLGSQNILPYYGAFCSPRGFPQPDFVPAGKANIDFDRPPATYDRQRQWQSTV